MNLDSLKFIAAFLLWVVAFSSGLLPILIRNFRTNKLFISLSQCFAGGLFLAVGLIHILPEAREKLEGSWKLADGHDDDRFPLSYFLCLLTFSLILLIDKVLFNNTDMIEQIEGKIDLRTSHLRKSILGTDDMEDPENNFKERVSHNVKLAISLSRLNLEHAMENDKSEDYLEIPEDKLDNAKKENQIMDTDDHDHDHHDHDHSEHKNIKDQKDQNVHQLSDTKNSNFNKTEHKHGNVHKHDHQGHDHHGHHHASVKKGSGYMQAFILLTAMGIHGLFEGLALGVESEQKEFVNLFLAILAHKWCDSLVVGFSFVGAELPKKMSLYLTLFLSLFTPAGVLIGYCWSSNMTVTGVFQALSAGTFIYISCAEIIIEEFAIAEKKFWKFLMYCFGILFVTLMITIEH